jgi:hypothetical protein
MTNKQGKALNCKGVDGILLAYLDNELETIERTRLEQHLSDCSRCRNELADLRVSIDKLSRTLCLATSNIEPSPRAWHLVSQKLKTERAGMAGILNLNPNFWRLTLKPVAIVFLATLLALSLNALHFLAPESATVLAETLVMGNTDVRNALQSQNIAQVEVISTIINEQGTFYIVSVTTPTNNIVARVNLDSKQVSNIIPVDLPAITVTDEAVIFNIARSDDRVQKLLARGAILTDIGRITDFRVEGLVDNYGIIHRQGIAKMTGYVTLSLGRGLTRVTMDIEQQKVTSVKHATTLPNISQSIAATAAPFLIAAGMVVLVGLFFRNKLAAASAGLIATAFGLLGLTAIISLPDDSINQILFFGIPVTGLALGITVLARHLGNKWLSIVGITLCLVAMLAGLFFLTTSLQLG